MGLTANSTGLGAVDTGLHIIKEKDTDKVIALAGNPNVGKSTVFNSLTGLNQHTGNWPGKTVTNAQGHHRYKDKNYILVDLPGTYSLLAHSTEEEAARDFICFGGAECVVVVCDGTCLERNLNLVLQIIEITSQVVVCVNLMDEAARKQIHLDLDCLEELLGVPVVSTSARTDANLGGVMEEVRKITSGERVNNPIKIRYISPVEEVVSILSGAISPLICSSSSLNSRFVALQIIDNNPTMISSINKHLGFDICQHPSIIETLKEVKVLLEKHGISQTSMRDKMVSSIVMTAEDICNNVVSIQSASYNKMDRRLDKILTNRLTGIPIMLVLLCIIFWLTIVGANYPSQAISTVLFWVQDRLTDLFTLCGAPDWLHGALVLGIYRVLAWVVSVMLPPMAIFFPLFTLLEDFGYLPRVAFNLDHHFKKCNACGKQALTMSMGFGCNAAGIVGCRIIDSPRERLIAIITNNFVPCNGRFPTLIAIITMFFAYGVSGWTQSILSTIILTGVIVLGITMTFMVSKGLSHTILKGVPSSFTLELPPYRKPQFGKVIVHSLVDRTLFVLGRAMAVAAPAGLLIWIMANISINDMSLLAHCSGFLDPFAQLLGMDGVILLAFILGFPANEIVFPIIIMAYLSSGTIMEFDNLTQLKALLVDNGWTWVTAISTMLFCLMHWPCSTACLTIRKETQSLKWTALSFLIPTVIGMIVCFLFTTVVRVIGI